MGADTRRYFCALWMVILAIVIMCDRNQTEKVCKKIHNNYYIVRTRSVRQKSKEKGMQDSKYYLTTVVSRIYSW